MSNEYPLRKYDKINSICIILGFSIGVIDLIISLMIPINIQNAELLIELFIPVMICIGIFTYLKLKYPANTSQRSRI